MTDHTHTAVALPATPGDRLKNSAKALVTAIGVAATSAAVAFVANPTTAHDIGSVVPVGLQPFVPIVLGALTAVGTWYVKNTPLPGRA